MAKMLAKPEHTVELYYYKCKIINCDKPYGIMQTARQAAEVGWFHHAIQNHRKRIIEVPPYVIRHKTFRAARDE